MDNQNKFSNKFVQGLSKGFGQDTPKANQAKDHFSHLANLKGDIGDVLNVHSTIKNLNKGGMNRNQIKEHMLNSPSLKQYANNYAKSEGWDVSKDKDFYNRFADDTLRDAFIENGKDVYVEPNKVPTYHLKKPTSYQNRYDQYKKNIQGQPFNHKYKTISNTNPTDEEYDEYLKQGDYDWWQNRLGKFHKEINSKGIKSGPYDKLIIQGQDGKKQIMDATDFFESDFLADKNGPQYVQFEDGTYGAVTNDGMGNHYKILGNPSKQDLEDLQEPEQTDEEYADEERYDYYNRLVNSGWSAQDAYEFVMEEFPPTNDPNSYMEESEQEKEEQQPSTNKNKLPF